MNTQQPWLKPNGRSLNDKELKTISRNWDQNTWEAYLSWFEGKRSYELLEPEHYDRKCQVLTKSVYEEHGNESHPVLAEYFDGHLKKLPRRYRDLIRRSYYEGMSVQQLAKVMRITCRRVNQLKAKALSVLATSVSPETLPVFGLVRGIESTQRTDDQRSIFGIEV